MAPAISKDLALSMYRKMYLIRRFEERAAQAYTQGKINGFCHLYIGQEAVAVGTTEALRPDDYQLGAYRDHAYPLTRGADPGMVMAELFGKATGYCKGKGGSMHIFDVEHYVLGGYGIVGGQIPLAAGLGFASKYRNDGRVTVCYFGEAAANQGAFHETLNMAAKWTLPVIFLCENNRYGMGTAFARVSPMPEVYKRASAYGIRGEAVDGMDVLAVRECVGRAVERARRDKVPALVEARTYRFRGHSMRDPAGAVYRTRDEVEREKQRDPIVVFAERCVKDGALTEADVKIMEKSVADQVDEAVAFADASPPPEPAELFTDVYKD